MANKDYKITGLILAGGQGQRVGRQNKGMLKLQGIPMAQHVLSNLEPQLDSVIISANEDIDDYKKLVDTVVGDDPMWQGKGPLAGIISAAQKVDKAVDAIQIVPCDTPFLPGNLVEKLADALFSDSENEIAYATTQNRIHPSVFLCKPQINQALAAHLADGNYSLKSWIFKHHAVAVHFENEDDFMNINDLETLARLQ